jgi:hypothetical protein
LNEELVNGYFTSPAQFVTKAVAKGYKWVAYQWNDETLGPQQQALASATRQACEGKLIFTVWLTRPFDGAMARQVAIESGCEGLILEAEIPAHRPEAPNWSEVTFLTSDLPIPKAVAATTAPFIHENGLPWPEKAKPLVDAGWSFLSQCFISESPNSTPEAMDFYATRHLGWSETQPMVEGWRIPDYGDLSRFRNVSHWDAGNVL